MRMLTLTKKQRSNSPLERITNTNHYPHIPHKTLITLKTRNIRHMTKYSNDPIVRITIDTELIRITKNERIRTKDYSERLIT